MFIPAYIKRDTTPYWVKVRALYPPPKDPQNISFNRACYLPDDDQKELSIQINRKGNSFYGFLRSSQQLVDDALRDINTLRRTDGLPEFDNEVYFVYSPVYDLENMDKPWPNNVAKDWGIGYNACHADLRYDIAFERGEPNIFFSTFATHFLSVPEKYCDLLTDENEDAKNTWNGEYLCMRTSD